MKLLKLGLLFIAFSVFSQQSGIVEYKFSYDTFDKKNKNPMQLQGIKMAEQSAEYAKEHKYILKFNKNESLYFVEKSIPIDGIQNQFAYRFSDDQLSKGKIYYNRKTGELLNERKTMGKLYLVTDKPKYEWKITGRTKMIGKYKVYEAKLKCEKCLKPQLVTAWYAPDIPLPYGPAGYGGLPGLILELHKYKYTLTVDKIKFKNIVDIKKLDKGEPITEKELKAKQMEARYNLMKRRRK